MNDIFEFFTLCKDFVSHYPVQNTTCNRVNTWAALESYADLNTTNLSKTVSEADKDFFFSRSWAANELNPSKLGYDYPAMIALEKSIAISKPFNGPGGSTYSFEIAFLDRHYEHSEDADYCSNRNRHEIFRDTETLLMNFFEYLRGVIYSTELNTYINKAVLASKSLPLSEDVTLTTKFQRMLNNSNQELFASRWEGGIDGLQGTFAELKINIKNCGKFDYSATHNSLIVGSDRGC